MDNYLLPQKEAKERQAARNSALGAAEQAPPPPDSTKTECKTLNVSKLEETAPARREEPKVHTRTKTPKVISMFESEDGKHITPCFLWC